jgi:L-lactate dehydrogenase complex protein LldG
MARIRAALGRSPSAAPVPPPSVPAVDESIVRVASKGADLLDLFARQAAATGMVVHRTLAAAAPSLIADLLRRAGAGRVAVADSLTLQTLGITAAVQRENLELVNWRGASGLEPLYDADAGITDVQAAIAETGSLVCCSGAQRARGLSLAPPIHIAIVRRSDILADLLDYLGPGEPRQSTPAPSNTVLITGPSKTADIEGILVTGVHGPREVHVVLVENA